MCIPFPIQLGMFTWPTPFKYPESMFKYTEAVAVVYLDEGYMSKVDQVNSSAVVLILKFYNLQTPILIERAVL